LALVKADSKHFRESRKFLSEMWEELRRTSDEEKPNCNKQEVKNCVSDALAELEILVNGKENSDNDKLNNQKKKKRRLNNRLTDLIKDGEEVNDLTELKEIIAKIEKFRGEEKYDSLKDKINKLKKKLANQNSSEYCKINREMIENELKEDLIKEEELDNEIKKELEKLRIGIINQIEIDEIKNKISDNIKLKKAEKELDSLLNSYRVSLSSREKKNLLKKLNSFTKKKNYFSQQACQKKKNEIEEKKNQLKSNSFSQQSSLANDNFPLAAKSMIGVYLLTAAIIVLKKIPKIR
jgi:DNA repair exonuclease SbcCD ATPase subunit